MSVHRRLGGSALAIGLVASAIVLAGVAPHGAPGTPSPGIVSDRFWNSLWANGTFETFADAGLAATESDVVVVGRITSIDPGRVVEAVPDFGADGVLSFASAHVKVDEVLAGTYVAGSDGTLALELFLPRASSLGDLQASTPPERTLLFLRLSPSGGKGVYALLNPESIVRDIAGSRIVAWAEEPWLIALRDLPFDSIVESLRAES